MFGGRISALFRFRAPLPDTLVSELEDAKKELNKATKKLEVRTLVIQRKTDNFERIVKEMRGEGVNGNGNEDRN